MSILHTDLQSNKLMVQEISKLIAKYEQKLTSTVTSHSNLQSLEFDHIKKILAENQDKINKNKLQIDELMGKIHTVQKKMQQKINNLTKQLQSFRLYYNQCYEYTLFRVNQVSYKVSCFSNEITNEFKKFNITQVAEYVKYVNQMVASIVKNASLRKCELKHEIDQQVFQLEIMLGKYASQLEQIDTITDELKSISYGNESLQQSVLEATKSLKRSKQLEQSQANMGKKIINHFEPKFKEIIKRINSYSLEIQMIKQMINSDNKNISVKQKQYDELQRRLDELEALIQEQKKSFEQQLTRKDDLLKKRGERIRELEESLHVLMDKEIKMQHQIAELKIHNLEYEKEIQRLQNQIKRQVKDNRAISTQTQHTQSFHGEQSKVSSYKIPEQILEDSQKLILIEMQYENLQRKYKLIENQLRDMKKIYQKDRNEQLKSELLISHRMATSQSKRTLNDVQQTKSCSRSYTKIPISGKHRDTFASSNFNQKSFNELYKENQKLQKTNLQLLKANKELQSQIMKLLNQKSKENEEDDEYLDQVQAQLEKNVKEIQRLSEINLELSRKIIELQASNQKLEEQLILQREQLKQKVKNYQNFINKLEKQKEVLLKQSKQLQKKYGQIDEIKSPTSFCGNKSSKSIKYYPSQHEIEDSQLLTPKTKKTRKFNTFLVHLENAIVSMGLPIPILCEVNRQGYVKEQKTGNYLVDENKNPLQISQPQLQAAIQKGLLMI